MPNASPYAGHELTPGNVTACVAQFIPRTYSPLDNTIAGLFYDARYRAGGRLPLLLAVGRHPRAHLVRKVQLHSFAAVLRRTDGATQLRHVQYAHNSFFFFLPLSASVRASRMKNRAASKICAAARDNCNCNSVRSYRVKVKYLFLLSQRGKV